MNKPDLTFVAHRLRDGKSFYPENSIEAYKDALRNPRVGGLEFDIQRTKDGRFVLMNYKTIENVTTLLDPSKNKISDYTYDELTKMRFHANLQEIEEAIITNAQEFGDQAPQMLEYYKKLKAYHALVPIPTLEDILKIPRNGKELFIEIKSNYTPEQKQEMQGYVRDLFAVLNKYDLSGVSIIGRDTNTLEAIKQERPSLTCMPVVGFTNLEAVTHDLDGASVAYDQLVKNVPGSNEPIWRYLAKDGKKIAVWNLRTYESFKEAEKSLRNTGRGWNPTGDFISVIAEQYEGEQNRGR